MHNTTASLTVLHVYLFNFDKLVHKYLFLKVVTISMIIYIWLYYLTRLLGYKY